MKSKNGFPMGCLQERDTVKNRIISDFKTSFSHEIMSTGQIWSWVMCKAWNSREMISFTLCCAEYPYVKRWCIFEYESSCLGSVFTKLLPWRASFSPWMLPSWADCGWLELATSADAFSSTGPQMAGGLSWLEQGTGGSPRRSGRLGAGCCQAFPYPLLLSHWRWHLVFGLEGCNLSLWKLVTMSWINTEMVPGVVWRRGIGGRVRKAGFCASFGAQACVTLMQFPSYPQLWRPCEEL
jgi:hypothetical protein